MVNCFCGGGSEAGSYLGAGQCPKLNVLGDPLNCLNYRTLSSVKTQVQVFVRATMRHWHGGPGP